MNRAHGWAEGIARLFLAGIFIERSVLLLLHPEIQMEKMVTAGIPLVPVFFVTALTLLLLGSTGLLLGYRARAASFWLLIYLAIDSLFIRMPLGSSVMTEFFLRLALLGALILVMLHGPGYLSFDAQRMVPVRRKR